MKIIDILKKIRLLFLVNITYRNYKIGKGFHSCKGVRLWAKNELIIGTNFYIGRYSQIECDAIIGNNVILGNFVSLAGRYDHNYQQIGTPIALTDPIRSEKYKWRGLNHKVLIQDDVWVGIGSIVLSGVTIGTGSIVAAGSVVVNDVEPFSIVAGVPAKKIGNRFNTDADLEAHKKIIQKPSAN